VDRAGLRIPCNQPMRSIAARATSGKRGQRRGGAHDRDEELLQGAALGCTQYGPTALYGPSSERDLVTSDWRGMTGNGTA
jgi:hypothetical protein